MQAPELQVGTRVTIDGPQQLTGEVIASRPGHCKCALSDGRAVWIPVERLIVVAAAPVAGEPGSDGAPAPEAAAEPVRPFAPAAALAPGAKAFPWAWLVLAFVVTLVAARFGSRAGFGATSAVTVPLVFFGVLAIWKRNRTLRTAAQVFVVANGFGLVTTVSLVKDLTNPPEVNAQIQERLKQLAAEEVDATAATAAEARRLETLQWAQSVSRGNDARAFAALAELQEHNVQLAAKLEQASSAVDFSTAPPGLSKVKSREDLDEQAQRLKAHAAAASAWLTHYENAPVLFEKVLRAHDVEPSDSKEALEKLKKALPAHIAVYERLVRIDEIHGQLYALLAREWGNWTYDAVSQTTSFTTDPPVAKHNQLMALLRVVVGGAESAPSPPRAPQPRDLEPRDLEPRDLERAARAGKDPLNPRYEQDRDNYLNEMREQQRERSAAYAEQMEKLRRQVRR